MDAFAIARLLMGAGFLAVAAFLDVRTRRVQDPLWIALGSLGLLLAGVELAVSYWVVNHWLLLASTAILFFAVFYGKPILDEDGVRLRPIRILVLAVAAIAWLLGLLWPLPMTYGLAVAGPFLPLAALGSVPVLLVVYQGFYQLGLLRGGADTKAMMALTILVPWYPEAAPFPLLTLPVNVRATMEYLFPFSLVVLVNAALLFLLVPIAYVLLNAARGDFEWPQGLFGTKANLDRIPRHVWLMERVDRHGERVAVLFPSHRADDSKEIGKLKAAGADRVWVQPKVPFMVPLLAGFLLAFVVGNLMLAFLTAVLPHP